MTPKQYNYKDELNQLLKEIVDLILSTNVHDFEKVMKSDEYYKIAHRLY